MASNSSSVEELSEHLDQSLSLSNKFVPTPSALTHYPAVNHHQTAVMTARLLAANHVKHHCFFNEKRFHNHIAHHVLALYALGADPAFVKFSYDREAPIQRPIGGQDKEPITFENWTSFLGEVEYYGNYLKFFLSEIEKTSAIQVVHKFVFESTQGPMLSRSFAGLLHPLIHWGYGLEFKIDGILAEGLAMAAVHRDTFEGLKIKELLAQLPDGQNEKANDKDFNQLDSQVSFDFRGETADAIFRPKSGLSAFQIIHEILRDPKMEFSHFHVDEAEDAFSKISKSQLLHSWLNKWEIGANCDQKEIAERTKELLWAVTVVYMATYDIEKQRFMLDFFFMHLVTSSLFLPTILPIIDRRYRPVLLKAFFRTAITVWVACKRPELRIEQCLDEPSHMKVPDSQHPTDYDNSWFQVLESAARHVDEHTTKIIRALAFNAKTWGSVQPGYYSCDLQGSELLDSSIFLRASVMTLGKLDWKREGNKRGMKWFS